MDLIQAVVLALVQGLTEFLPVSSSAHLLLVPIFADWPDQGLAFDVALHVGSLIAVVIYFWQDIKRMFFAWIASIARREDTKEGRLAWAVIFGTIPVCIVGFFLKDIVATAMRSPLITAFGLIVFGLLLAWADWRHRGVRDEYQIKKWDVVWIGCAQALALIPGTSRSGITLTVGMMLGFTREAAARFSFLLSIPVIVIAGAFETHELIHAKVAVDWTAMAVGTVISGISAYLCIHYFLAFISRIGMQPFVIYRIALGILLIALYWNPTA